MVRWDGSMEKCEGTRAPGGSEAVLWFQCGRFYGARGCCVGVE